MPDNLVIWHVGGGGGSYGHAEKLAEANPGSTFVLFEVLPYEEAPFISQPGRTVVNRCLGAVPAQRPFHQYDYTLCSSLYRVNMRYADEVTGNPRLRTWGEHASILHTAVVDVTTVDEMARTLPAPDFLSLDAQGSEYEILSGAKATLRSVLGIITEFQTIEVYVGQRLLSDQMQLLQAHGFRLADLVHREYWHQASLEEPGLGMLTAGDALFLRGDLAALSQPQLASLQRIATYFGRLSFAAKIERTLSAADVR